MTCRGTTFQSRSPMLVPSGDAGAHLGPSVKLPPAILSEVPMRLIGLGVALTLALTIPSLLLARTAR
jgi:hypothetical protein